jgi:hypothetical protein
MKIEMEIFLEMLNFHIFMIILLILNHKKSDKHVYLWRNWIWFIEKLHSLLDFWFDGLDWAQKSELIDCDVWKKFSSISNTYFIMLILMIPRSNLTQTLNT